MQQLPNPATVQLQLSDYSLTWAHFWDEERKEFSKDVVKNLHLLFIRAVLAGKLPRHFHLRFGKDCATLIRPRAGDADNQICGLSRSWLGKKVVPTESTRLPHFRSLQFAVVACCGVQCPDPLRCSVAGSSAHSSTSAARRKRVTDAATQTDFDYEAMLQWVLSMRSEQGGEQPNTAAATQQGAESDTESDTFSDASTDSECESPGQFAKRLQSLASEKTHICGAPVIIGRRRRGQHMTVTFLGKCEHTGGAGTTSGAMSAVVQEEILSAMEARGVTASDLGVSDLWEALDRLLDGDQKPPRLRLSHTGGRAAKRQASARSDTTPQPLPTAVTANTTLAPPAATSSVLTGTPMTGALPNTLGPLLLLPPPNQQQPQQPPLQQPPLQLSQQPQQQPVRPQQLPLQLTQPLPPLPPLPHSAQDMFPQPWAQDIVLKAAAAVAAAGMGQPQPQLGGVGIPGLQPRLLAGGLLGPHATQQLPPSDPSMLLGTTKLQTSRALKEAQAAHKEAQLQELLSHQHIREAQRQQRRQVHQRSADDLLAKLQRDVSGVPAAPDADAIAAAAAAAAASVTEEEALLDGDMQMLAAFLSSNSQIHLPELPSVN